MNKNEKIKIKKYGVIKSTQLIAKELIARGENTIVSAVRQSGGMGTKGRSFSAEKGGVYLSTLFFYRGFNAENAFLIMAGTCAAVCKAIEEGGLTPKIKWPNDVYVGGKKICGILTENVFSAAHDGKCDVSSVCGIGLNVNNELPESLLEIATSVCAQKGKTESVKAWRKRLIAQLIEMYFAIEKGGEKEREDLFAEYEKYFGFVGENVLVSTEDGQHIARVLGVDRRGMLIAKSGGTERKYAVGEVTKLTV